MRIACSEIFLDRRRIASAAETHKIAKVYLRHNAEWKKDEVIVVLDNEEQFTAFAKAKNALIRAYGEETDEWVGKAVQLSIVDDKLTVLPVQQQRL